MSLVLKIEGFVDGPASEYDGSYLLEYDPGRGEPGEAWLVTVADPAEARHFRSWAELFATWQLVDPRQPVRLDGKPNRPLTAFSISIESLRPDGSRLVLSEEAVEIMNRVAELDQQRRGRSLDQQGDEN